MIGRCIKWVQEAFPSGGDTSGLILIYEQCVRSFWHSDRYKDDLRYLKVWLEYVSLAFLLIKFFGLLRLMFCGALFFFIQTGRQAENCMDAEIVYSFLDTNEIGKTHSLYYTSYALHMESKNKIKFANDVLNLGISR